MELSQRFRAQFLGVKLQGRGEARDLRKFHTAAAGFPQNDAFRRDAERFRNVSLQQAQFLAPAAQQEVQGCFIPAIRVWAAGKKGFSGASLLLVDEAPQYPDGGRRAWLVVADGPPCKRPTATRH